MWVHQFSDERKVFRDFIAGEVEDVVALFVDAEWWFWVSEITKYFRFIAKLVNPYMADAELSLISTHFLRVYACVLLHEAGKDGPYFKLRLRWLSDCFNVYLRNTDRITQMRTEALSDEHSYMENLLEK